MNSLGPTTAERSNNVKRTINETPTRPNKCQRNIGTNELTTKITTDINKALETIENDHATLNNPFTFSEEDKAYFIFRVCNLPANPRFINQFLCNNKRFPSGSCINITENNINYAFSNLIGTNKYPIFKPEDDKKIIKTTLNIHLPQHQTQSQIPKPSKLSIPPQIKDGSSNIEFSTPQEEREAPFKVNAIIIAAGIKKIKV